MRAPTHPDFSWQCDGTNPIQHHRNIKNVKGEPIESAIVFIDGSKQITRSDKSGTFKFSNLAAGTYQVVINMMGYKSVKQNVIIRDQSAAINISMQEKQIRDALEINSLLNTNWAIDNSLFQQSIGRRKTNQLCGIARPRFIKQALSMPFNSTLTDE